MNWYDYLIFSLFTSIMLFISSMCYDKLSTNVKFRPNTMDYIVSLISGFLITINTFYNDGYSRALVSYVIIMISFYIIKKDEFNSFIIKGTIYYILILLVEIVLSIIFVGTGLFGLFYLDNNFIFKSIFSIVVVASVYGILSIPKIKKFINKIIIVLDRPFITGFVLLLSILAIATVSYKLINNLSTKKYLDSMMLFLFFALLIYLILYNRLMVTKEVKKTKELLEALSIYEQRIDEDRILRHEMLNNLLALKSFKDKNSEDFNNTLDEFIMSCSKKSVGIKNIYKLPSGLKGIVYYKLNSLDNKKYNYNVNISKQVNIKLEKENYKEYISLCKILGIVLDNAIEACEKTKDKFLTIDVYNEKGNVIIDVENSYKDKISDINMLYSKNYSSKGHNRGLGLHVAKMLLKSSKYLEMNQEIMNDNIFITKILIKQKI